MNLFRIVTDNMNGMSDKEEELFRRLHFKRGENSE
jgi:hypothetical protein